MSWKVPSSKLPYNIGGGGGSGVLPWKILKTKNAAEAISGHLAVLYKRIPFSDFQWDSVPNFICCKCVHHANISV